MREYVIDRIPLAVVIVQQMPAGPVVRTLGLLKDISPHFDL